MGTGAAAVPLAVHVCAGSAVAEVRAADCAAGWADSRARTGKSLGPALGGCFSDSRPAGKQQRLRPERIAQSPEARRQGHGQVWGEFLQVAGLRAVAADFLGAIAIYETRRS